MSETPLTPVETLAEVKKVLHTKHHFLVIRRGSWFIRHPLECRAYPDVCEMTAHLMSDDEAIENRLMSLEEGTYLMQRFMGITLEMDVRLTKVDDATDPMMARLKELGVW
jgi:hypothetical protein